jgi:hypothetical protein
VAGVAWEAIDAVDQEAALNGFTMLIVGAVLTCTHEADTDCLLTVVDCPLSLWGMTAIRRLAVHLKVLAITGALVAVIVPAVSAAAAADTTLIETSSESTVTVTVGQAIAVNLPAAYRPVTVTGFALTALSSSGGFPSGQPLSAAYLAVAPGNSDLRTLTDYPCLHNVPRCTVPQRQWIVHVIVVPATRTVMVTEAESRSVLSLRVGDTLVVSLPHDYQPTRLTGPALILTQSSGGFPTGQPMSASYLAAQPGSVDVITMTDAACLHAPRPCMIPQLLWIVHVTVTA